MKQVKFPSPEHPISVEAARGHVKVLAGTTLIASSANALVLREANYPPVYYIPPFDIALDQLEPSDHETYCPYKGDCTYFDVPAAGEQGKNAVWSYQRPYKAVRVIAGHMAFYPDRVSIVFTAR